MKITEREKDILKLLCLTDDEIAHKLKITKNTVRTHVKSLLNKLCEYKRINLLINAVKNEIISIEEVYIKHL